MIKSLTIASDESKCDMTLKDILARRDEVFKDEIGSDGLKKSQDKIDAILKVKKPENVTQLRSFIGLVRRGMRRTLILSKAPDRNVLKPDRTSQVS
jgi:hypothetical protein